MKQIRKKWLVPLFAFAIALGGAVASQASSESSMWVDGFVNTHKPCDIKVQCQTEGLYECTGPGGIAYGKDNPAGTSCTQPLFRL